MEGNSALPPALRDHLTRQVRQHETMFQQSNGRPMTDNDWVCLEERTKAAASSKGGKSGRKNTHISMPGKLALLAWQKLRAAGCKRTLNTTAHLKRRNSSSDPPILAARRCNPPDLKSKFEKNALLRRKITADGGNNYSNHHLTESSNKKQRRLKEIETEKILAGIEQNKFRRRSAHLAKAVSDAAAGIVTNQQQKKQKENDEDYSNPPRAPPPVPQTEFIQPRQSELVPAASTVFGPTPQPCDSRKSVSGDSGTAAASLNDSSVIKGQSVSCSHRPHPLQRSTCQQERSDDLDLKQLYNTSKTSSDGSNSSRVVNDAIDMNFASTDDCVKQTDKVTATNTLGLSSRMNAAPRMMQTLEDHSPSPDGASVSENNHPINNNCSFSANNTGNNLPLSNRPAIVPLLPSGCDGGTGSDVTLPTSMFNSSTPHFQLSAASINALPPPGFGGGWGMRVSNAFKNSSTWKSIQASSKVMTNEEPRAPAVRNQKGATTATGGKNDKLDERNPATSGSSASSFQSETKKEHQQHLRCNSIGDGSQESNNMSSCNVNDAENSSAGAGGGVTNGSVQQHTTSKIDDTPGCNVIRGRKGSGGGNKVPFSVSDNFVRMDLRRKGNFRFKKRKGSGMRKGGGRFLKKEWNNSAWRGGEEQQGGGNADDLDECDNGLRSRSSDAMWTSSKQLQWKTERIEVGRGGKEDVLDCCVDMLAQQRENEEAAAAADGNNSGNNGISTGQQNTPTTFTGPRQVNTMDWEKLTPPPLCSAHRKPAKVLKVNKAGENRGRYFFACSQPRGAQCNFFMWVEDVPSLVRKYLMEPCESSEEWLKRRYETLRKDISKKTVPEIRKELVAAGLPNVGKNKAQLIDRFMKHLEKKNLIDDSPSQMPDNNNTQGGYESANDGGSQRSNSSDDSEKIWSSSSSFTSSSEDELELLTVANRRESDQAKEAISVEQQQPISSAVRECQRTVISKVTPPNSTSVRIESTEQLLGKKKAENLKVEVGLRLCNDKNAIEDGGKKNKRRPIMSEPLKILKDVFGHSSFRVGQEWAINRVLNGENALLVLATGSGKSLAYQLPALMLPGITVVVSPLISLMEDQLSRLPPQLPGACMSGSHSSLRAMAKTLKELHDGWVKVLFLSPERLCSPAFQRLIALKGAFPEVSLLCVDEAHCVSQWSHNFRPAYMRISSALDGLHPRSILGMTATASPSVISNICSILRICPRESVKIGSWMRPNLFMDVSRCSNAEEKRVKLCSILAEGGRLEHGSCIVYVWLQRTAEALAEQLTSRGHKAVSYHGGMDSKDRKKAQKAFMKGRARIIVATIAFGLGVDMNIVRGVVHYDMPTSVEGYVQEIGRAGRDGKEAYCHVLFSDSDFRSHHSLAHSNGLELVQIRGLLRTLFCIEEKVGMMTSSNMGVEIRHIAVRLKDVCARLDLREEVVETLLSLLEVASRKIVRLRGVMLDHCVIEFQKKKPLILAELNAVIAAVCKVGVEVNNNGPPTASRRNGYSLGCFKVGLIDVTRALGGKFSPYNVLKELRRLRDEGDIDYSLSERSYHVTVDCCDGKKNWFDNQKLNVLAEALLSQMRDSEVSEVRRIEEMYSLLSNSVTSSTDELRTNNTTLCNQRSVLAKKKEASFLQDRITQYFEIEQSQQDEQQWEKQGIGEEDDKTVDNSSTVVELPHDEMVKHQSMLQHDAAILMSDPTFRGVAGSDGRTFPHSWILKDKAVLSRAMARCFHGIGSVAFPSTAWRQSPLWRRYVHLSFEDVLSVIASTVSDLVAKYEKRNAPTGCDS